MLAVHVSQPSSLTHVENGVALISFDQASISWFMINSGI